MIGAKCNAAMESSQCSESIYFHYRLQVNTFLESVFAYKQQMQVMSFSLIGFSVGNTTLESFFLAKSCMYWSLKVVQNAEPSTKLFVMGKYCCAC